MIQFARSPLVNGCGIQKTIGNHARATFEGRLNYFAHELASARFKKEQLGLGGHIRIMWSKLEQFTDRFSDRCAAGFACKDVRDIASLKVGGQFVGLCRLPASFRSLERDERQPRHDFTWVQAWSL